MSIYSSHDAPVCGRFAPSPTGRMHLGNIYTAVLSCYYARRKGGRWILRIEDLDPQRSRSEYADILMDDLQWLGLQWDGEPQYQSHRHDIYAEALGRLSALGLVYPCRCTRADIMATQAPHQSDGHIVYAGTCRPNAPLYDAASLAETLRMMVPPYPDFMFKTANANIDFASASPTIGFDDMIHGHTEVNLAETCGDFVLRRRDGAWAYQLAVAVDDALMGVTQVVRGEDLLLSTAVQRYIQSLLDLPMPTEYIHLPLLCNRAGQRLSKRDGAMAMDQLRMQYTPRQIIEMICLRAGLDTEEVLSVIRRKS